MPKPLSPLAAALLLCGAITAPPPASAGRPAAQFPTPPDTAQLRKSLARALGGDFQIVRHEVSEGTRERGGPFWLVHVRPTRSGDWHLRYRYKYVDRVHPENPLYTHVQHDSYVRVGAAGCGRRRQAKEGCVGDTIILPFVLGQFSGHTFTVEYRGPDTGQELGNWDDPRGFTAADSSIANPAAPVLRYLGMRRTVMLHRIPGSTTVYTAAFEAVAPGRLNLALQPRLPGAGPPRAVSWEGSVPVLVVPRGQPVTTLLPAEEVTGMDETRGFSSHSGNEYPTTLLLLQPGDRISLEFSRSTVRGHDAPRTEDDVRAVVPIITRLPFRLDTDDRFNTWIAPWLPAGADGG